MLLNGDSPESYGRLIAWNDDDDAMAMCFDHRGHPPGQGLLILEIQEKILDFLLQCCSKILHDVPSDALTDDSIPAQPEPPSLKNTSGNHTLASMVAEAPYRLPAQIDFERLLSILSSKRSASEDYVWSLREDPSLFQDALLTWSEHRQEQLPMNGRRDHVLDTPLFWEHVLRDVITNAYFSLFTWDILCKQLQTLIRLKEVYTPDILPEKSLPAEYLRAVLTFKYTIENLKRGPIAVLKVGLFASPPLRSLSVRVPKDSNTDVIRLRQRSSSADVAFIWLFVTLFDSSKLFLCGFPALMDEIERFMERCVPNYRSILVETEPLETIVAD